MIPYSSGPSTIKYYCIDQGDDINCSNKIIVAARQQMMIISGNNSWRGNTSTNIWDISSLLFSSDFSCFYSPFGRKEKKLAIFDWSFLRNLFYIDKHECYLIYHKALIIVFAMANIISRLYIFFTIYFGVLCLPF